MPATHQLAVTEHLPDGPGRDGPLVVLVHGSLDRASSFARVLRRLDDLHTVAYDRRGYDRSRVLPVHDTIEGHIGDLLAVIDQRPAVVVGHSYGGVIALGAAVSDAGKASILSLGAYEPPLPWLGFRRNPPPGSAGGPPDGGDAAEAAERFFRRMVGDSAWERLPDAVKAERRADGPALVAELGAIRIEKPPFDPTELAVPAVFGRGGASLPHHRDGVAWLVAHVPGSAMIEIPGAAHGAHLTHPDAFADLARAAVSRAGARGVPG
jgi:pimeloyl-ACP methyl ester carboxylesterase